MNANTNAEVTAKSQVINKLHKIFTSLDMDMDDIAACMDAIISNHGLHFHDHFYLLDQAERENDQVLIDQLEYSEETSECFYEAINSKACDSPIYFSKICDKFLTA